jgi:hypothetical protein
VTRQPAQLRIVFFCLVAIVLSGGSRASSSSWLSIEVILA